MRIEDFIDTQSISQQPFYPTPRRFVKDCRDRVIKSENNIASAQPDIATALCRRAGANATYASRQLVKRNPDNFGLIEPRFREFS